MNWDKSPNARPLPRDWKRRRALVLKRDSYLCVVCRKAGRVEPATEVDHVIPRSKGGDDSMANLAAICRRCHDRKTIEDAGGTYHEPIRIGIDGFPVETPGRGGR